MQVKHVFLALGICAALTACPRKKVPQVSETATQTQISARQPFGTGGLPPTEGKPTERAGITQMFANPPDRGSIRDPGNAPPSTGTATGR